VVSELSSAEHAPSTSSDDAARTVKNERFIPTSDEGPKIKMTGHAVRRAVPAPDVARGQGYSRIGSAQQPKKMRSAWLPCQVTDHGSFHGRAVTCAEQR
jgi:hypothetical protein